MAGGKETPRQKMIGMMYLVLTALLALQVSNSVLEKFVYINKVLEGTNAEATIKNKGIVNRIKAAVEEKGSRTDDVKVLEKAKDVRTRTDEVFKQLQVYKETIIDLTGGTDENGNFIGVKDEDKVANYMLNQGEGEKMRTLLNDYAKFLSEETGEEFSTIALDAKDDPLFQNDPNQNKKDFAHLNFQSTPMAAGLATLSEFQSRIIGYETEALDELALQVGARDVSFDVIRVVVKPESKIVASGAKFRAEMFIAASSSGDIPDMAVNNKPIKVDEQGIGSVEFPVKATKYDKDGFSQQSFTGQIIYEDTTFEAKIEYIVARPVIRVQSASVTALYLNCGNELQVDVPALGSDYNPSFTAKGGKAISGGGGKVTVVPNSANVDLNVNSGGNYIGTEKFKVRRIPKPTVELLSRGKSVNEKTGMPAPGPRSLDIKAVPDESFAQFLPKDARYRISDWEVTLARGSRPVATKRVKSEKTNLNEFASKARPGDRIVIEVKKVQRMNFQNKVEDVNLGVVIKTIPLH